MWAGWDMWSHYFPVRDSTIHVECWEATRSSWIPTGFADLYNLVLSRHLGHLRGSCGVSEIKLYLWILDSNSRLMSCTKWFPFFSSADCCRGIMSYRGLTASWTACKLGCLPFEAPSTFLVLYQSRADCSSWQCSVQCIHGPDFRFQTLILLSIANQIISRPNCTR